MRLKLLLPQPGAAVDGLPMGVQPRVLVQVCARISSQCNPLANVPVTVALESAEDEYTRVDKPSRTRLVCAGACEAVSDYDGVATFSGLEVDSPGSEGASFVKLNFTVADRSSAYVSANPFDTSAQENLAPQFVDPTPVFCEDDDAPLVYYAGVGTRLHLVLNASDGNTAPYDSLTIHVACNDMSSPGGDCTDVLPSNSYLTENMYPWATPTRVPYIPDCELARRLTAQSEPKKKLVRQQNRVERHLVWSPVKWSPAFSLTYKAIEAERQGYHNLGQATCARTVQVVVCDRPRFVAPSPLHPDDCSHMMALAGTDVVFTVAALDRNPDDVVEIMMIDAPDLQHVTGRGAKCARRTTAGDGSRKDVAQSRVAPSALGSAQRRYLAYCVLQSS
jgi:hypothetical protein